MVSSQPNIELQTFHFRKFFLNFLKVFFLQKYLVLQLFICAKLLIANYILATFLKLLFLCKSM